MARSKHQSQRKPSGGRYHAFRGKRKYELAGSPVMTKLDTEKKARIIRSLGGNKKHALLSTNQINLTSKGKTSKNEILNVIENPANPNLVRPNIITKGALVETKLGKARVTSRPGQDGCVNGILIYSN